MRRSSTLMIACAGLAAIGSAMVFAQPTTKPGDGTQVPIEITGGHDTVGADRGRPVVLIAAALGVPTEVFREAFSRVKPAQGRGPTDDEARTNKDALLGALSKYGVTNDRLDEVSNYYRYRRENGEMWTHLDAAGYATLREGKIVNVTMTEHGAGYSTPPTITVKDHPETTLTPTITFGKDLKTNGRIESIGVNAPTTQPAPR